MKFIAIKIMAVFSANTTNKNNETVCLVQFDSEVYTVLQQFGILSKYNGCASTLFREKHLEKLRNCYRAVKSQKQEFAVSPRTEGRVVYCKSLSPDDFLYSIEKIGLALKEYGEVFVIED